jgi:hypothetical protein
LTPAAQLASCSSSTCGRDLKRAIRQTGGSPIAEGFLTPEAVAEVAAELVALSEIFDELEAEEAATGA